MTNALEGQVPPDMLTRWELLLVILVINVPFGFWRAGVRKFSLSWFLAVHVPVIIGIGLRILSKLGWSLATFPALVGAFFLGQFLGGKLRRLWKGARDARGSAP
ncbi:MAG: hypothetical protein ABSA67_16280 [Candidatus Brocadiia bacterium]